MVKKRYHVNVNGRATSVHEPRRNQESNRKIDTVNNRNRNTSIQVVVGEGNRNVEREVSVNTRIANNNSRYNTSVRRSTGGTTATRSGNNSKAIQTGSRNSRVDNRSFYRHNSNDRRYVPNNSYRGSNKYWSNKYRPRSMNYNHVSRNFYRKYNYKNYSHWNLSWENYRWNVRSWRDYYKGYNPYAYRFNKYYYRYPMYGEVISRFAYRPGIYIHNHHRYYSYNGHFLGL